MDWTYEMSSFCCVLMACLLAGVVSQPMGMGDCPEGQIFCFMRERCVNLDGTCPDHLSCGDHEIVDWNLYGYEECQHELDGDCEDGQCDGYCDHDEYLDTSDGFPQCRPTDQSCPYGEIFCSGTRSCMSPEEKVTCEVMPGELLCPRGYQVCWQNARQECVPDDQCHFLSVTFQINASFPEVIGPNWEHFDSALAHIQNSTAAVLSVNRGMVFGLYAWEGSIWVHFGVPPELRSAIEALFYDQQRQFLANDDWSLDIVWGSLSIYEHLPITNPGDNPDMGSHCSDGMIYCLMTRQCVSINGAVPDCDSNMPCADYEVLCKDDMGGYYCSDQDCHGSSGNIQCPEGEIYCLMSKQCVNEVDASCSEQSFCSDFEYLDVTDGYPQCKYNDESCPYGEIYCYGTHSCESDPSMCADSYHEPRCPYHYKVCWRNDRQECVPDHECRSLAVMFMINGVFGDVFGVQMEHYDPVIGYIRAAIAASLSIEPAMMFNFQAWEGSIWVRFEAPEELWNAIEALFNGTMGQFLSDTTWNLDIDFGSVHMERLYGGERCPYGMNMCMNGTGSYYCSNMNCEEPEGMQQCPDDQLYCLMRKQCVNVVDASCSEQSFCLDSEVQCMGSFGNYYCSDNGCDEEVGTCPSDQYLDHSDGFPQCKYNEESCPAGEIYCHGTKACVSDTTLCADSFHEPRCPYAYKVCWRNNQQECVPDNECPSLAVEFRINGVFDEVFGVHMEHYEAVIGHIRTAIASSLSLVEQVDPGMLFGFDAWEGSIWVRFETRVGLLGAMEQLFNGTRGQFLTDKNWTLNIDFSSVRLSVERPFWNTDGGHGCSSGMTTCMDKIGGYYCSERNCEDTEGLQQCEDDQIFCLMSKQCVDMVDASCSEQSFCSDFEWSCTDIHGNHYCSDRSCDAEGMRQCPDGQDKTTL
ncbi:uncharacterized protein LOC128244365 [Mya arenaria]|uniref:uncharacterized protein LOC128244365 n=1 Tax=Mya arenaria TaxID=6604 RepID=UPI0022E2CBF1|nr:uncharacterized protein LOC128244365 [Mya arenaria]